jgi:hypothetical protein
MAAAVTSSSTNAAGYAVIAVIVILWVLPTVIAVRRDVPDKWLPILLSLLFGGLIIPGLSGCGWPADVTSPGFASSTETAQERNPVGGIRKTLRFTFSFGGYDGWSPIAKESATEKVARLLDEQNKILRSEKPLGPSKGKCCTMSQGMCVCKGSCGCACGGCTCS